MKENDIIKIGNIECKIVQFTGDWYLQVINNTRITNNQIYLQFFNSYEDFLKHCPYKNLKPSNGFPYHPSLETLIINIKFLQCLNVKFNVNNIELNNIIGFKNHPDYQNLKGRYIKFLKNYTHYKKEEKYVIENDESDIFLILLSNTGKTHSLNRNRFKEGIIKLVPLEETLTDSLVGRYIIWNKDMIGQSKKGDIDQIIDYNPRNKYYRLKKYGNCCTHRLITEEISLLPIDFIPNKVKEIKEWDKNYHDPLSLVGRHVKFEGIISYIKENDINSDYISLYEYGLKSRTFFDSGHIVLLPKNDENFVVNKSLEGRYVQWLISEECSIDKEKSFSKSDIDQIIEITNDGLIILKKFRIIDKSRFLKNNIKLLPINFQTNEIKSFLDPNYPTFSVDPDMNSVISSPLPILQNNLNLLKPINIKKRVLI